MDNNRLLRLSTYGQSIWLDFIRRGMFSSGELRRMIEEDGLRGVTSNPSIFEKAIAGSHDYDDAIRVMTLECRSAEDIYQAVTIEDLHLAADLFRPIFDQTEGKDGFVSLEVSPDLAHDTDGTIAEARRLWAAVDRPNVMIKVPGTREGLPAIRQLIGEGININITLLFGLPRYHEVAEAYIAGLEMRVAQGLPLARVASVASFFLSRIDVLVDATLEKKMQARPLDPNVVDTLVIDSLKGQVAIASAKVAYQIYKETFGSNRFRKLADRGARAQRLLWASTSAKNPAFSDVKYVESLIGPETVNTLPVETLNAYRDHGNPRPLLEEKEAEACSLLERLKKVGIDIDAVTQQLEDDGVQKFKDASHRLMAAIEEKRAGALHEPIDRQVFSLGGYEAAVKERITGLEQGRYCDRLWRKDTSLWKSDRQDQEAIRNSLGWLHVAEKMEENLSDLSDFVAEVRAAGFRQVVHLGMGGSSLAALVFERSFTPGDNALALTVLDTPDPATILRVERENPLSDTLFIVASKSGTTAEPLALGQYFYARVQELKGDRAGDNFIAITDPNTPLVRWSHEQAFRRIFLNFADIGGRYSALSYFGLVPAALMGVNVSELLARALRMGHACASCVTAGENPGLLLGAALGEMALRGRDKVTFLAPKGIETLGMWLEQLLAESTGKDGAGLLPVAGESIGRATVYGEDRVFVYIRFDNVVDDGLERGVLALREAGQPVITIKMEDILDLGQEFFRWQVATAIAGAIIGINPFDQPNVQESKENTNRLLTAVRAQAALEVDRPDLVYGPISLYAEDTASTVSQTLAQFLARARPEDYVALLAYLTEDAATSEALQAIRLRLRDKLHLSSTLGYGPRYLHSTGQYHKGGPDTGLFMLLTADDVEDMSVPGEPYTFGTFRRAQALGDLAALRKHGRRVLRIHLGKDVKTGLQVLEQALATAQ